MKNSTDKFVFIIIALFSAMLLTSIVNAEDKQFIAGSEVNSEDAASAEQTDILPEDSEDETPDARSDILPEDMEEFLKTLVLESGASCISVSCHADIEKKKYVHIIGGNGMKCSRCHEILIEGKHDFKKIPADTMVLCAKCHKAEIVPPDDLKKSPPKVLSEDEAKKLHKPFAEGKCTACHDAHSSNYYKHLKFNFPEGLYALYQENTYALCASCHKDLEKTLTEPRTLDLTMFRNGNVNLHYRHVNKKKGRTCKACHHAHGLDKPRLLRDTFQFGNRKLTVNYEKTETGGKCSTTCHRVAIYDRYKPEFNYIKTEPLPGEKATEAELQQSRRDDLKRLKEKADNYEQNNGKSSNVNQEDL